MDESEILNHARVYDELEVDDAWAADLSTFCFRWGLGEVRVVLFGEAWRPQLCFWGSGPRGPIALLHWSGAQQSGACCYVDRFL